MKPLGPSFVASLAWHAIVLFVAILIGRSAGGSREQVSPPSPSTQARLVWLDQAGPGGGGGGGGNRMAAPPRAVEARGRDTMSVVVAKPRALDVRVPPPDVPDPVQAVSIPARSLASSVEFLPGAIEGPARASPSQGPGDGGGAGTGRGTGDGPELGSGLGAGRNQGTGGDFYRLGNGITPPVEIRRAMPQYTTAAMQARVQGAVIIECVVQPSGVCTDARVVRSLDSQFGLDQEAVKASGQWRFRPGTRFGQPVPVLVTMEITFTLR